ncbi:MAG: zinc-ribbon domain-containing protein [Terriglobales bacterium]
MICPKCGEDNSENFRFCGMCGTPLEGRRPSGAPALDPLSAFPPKISPRATNVTEAVKPAVAEPAAVRAVNKLVPPISGPSMLGLNQPIAVQPSSGQAGVNRAIESQPIAAHANPGSPSIDLLRETSFSGFDSFMEPEERKTGVGRILLLLVLLAGLGVAGWWAYTNYVGATENQKLQAAISNAEQAPADKPADKTKDTQPAKPAAPDTSPAPDNGSPQTSSSQATPPPAAATSQQDNSEPTSKAAETEAKAAAPAKRADAPVAAPKTSAAHKSVTQREPLVATARTPSRPQGAPADTGDAAFRQGEAYLYGRGVRANCDEAVKNLKIASSQSNAKARSAFGTMYATGHCVPRDLPTSYLWFALALRADPANQILEKDLNAVWNQMTPPERQQATRMKQ